MSNKLDMSLDDLIKSSAKKKPAGQGAKKAAKQQPQKAKQGAKQLLQPQKGKTGAQQQQKRGVQVGLKAKGGIAKPGAKAGVVKPLTGKVR